MLSKYYCRVRINTGIKGVKREEATKVKGGIKVVDSLANGIESGSQKVAEVCVSAGEGIGKGAAK